MEWESRLYSLAISTELRGSMAPQLGRTQYFLGAVVLILNKTFFSVGFFRLMCDVTGCVNGPIEIKTHFLVRFMTWIGKKRGDKIAGI